MLPTARHSTNQQKTIPNISLRMHKIPVTMKQNSDRQKTQLWKNSRNDDDDNIDMPEHT